MNNKTYIKANRRWRMVIYIKADTNVVTANILESIPINVTSITTDLVINTVSINTIPVTLPFQLVNGDNIVIEYNLVNYNTQIILEGSY
jgi:hypothetical protein